MEKEKDLGVCYTGQGHHKDMVYSTINSNSKYLFSVKTKYLPELICCLFSNYQTIKNDMNLHKVEIII